MLEFIPPQLIALAAALSYATSGIAARRGMRYSTPITVTLVSLTVHALGLWSILLMTKGVPEVSLWVLLLFFITGTLQPVIRLCTYAGIFYMGASRGTTVRSSHPLFSTSIAILFLGERLNVWIAAGTLLIVVGVTLISWQPEAERGTYRWWHLAFPLGAALLAGISHPIRRYALGLANEPLFFAAMVGLVSLGWMTSYLVLPVKKEGPVWHPKAAAPFLIAGVFETLGIFLVITALSVGQVVIVSPIVATSPLWILVGTWLFLRGIENLHFRIIAGAISVVAGTVAISLVR
ncbi:MAG: DMT family transporter [Deltaproteobacteria bacterium]|nr:DMT family transporter [Deltaproteobacteria bacterium]